MNRIANLALTALLGLPTAAIGQTFTSSYSSSSSSAWGWPTGGVSGSLVLRGVSPIDALTQVESLGTARIAVSAAAAAVLRGAPPLTLSLAETDQRRALAEVLRPSGLVVVDGEGELRVVVAAESPSTVQVKPLRNIVLATALDRVVPIQLYHAPVSMAVAILEGASGVRIAGNAVAENPITFRPPTYVSLVGGGRPLRDVLNDLANQLRAEVVEHDGWVEVRPSATRPSGIASPPAKPSF